MKQILIIGGGPAGCMAAIACKTHNPSNTVILIEGNPRLGEKLRLTGGGRCNMTANVSAEEIIKHTPRNGRFLFSSLNNLDPQAIMRFFTERKLMLKEEDHQRIFPVSDKAEDVVNVLENELKQLGVKIQRSTLVTSIDVDHKQIKTSKGSFEFDHLIFATGGATYPQTGSNGQSFELLRQCGHTITPLKPAEVPLVSNASIIQAKELQGLSFKDISMTTYVNDKKIIHVTHDLLFTHFGLWGPAALQTSSYLSDAFKDGNKVLISIDFLPNVKREELEAQVKDLENALLSHGIPKRLIQVLKTREMLDVKSIKQFTLELHGTRGFTTAFVTCGGVSLKEIDPKTMRSKLVPWLSVCGEALDVNSLTGGYNMTVAFSTGYTAGWMIEN
jgi:hypothetical protein